MFPWHRASSVLAKTIRPADRRMRVNAAAAQAAVETNPPASQSVGHRFRLKYHANLNQTASQIPSAHTRRVQVCPGLQMRHSPDDTQSLRNCEACWFVRLDQQVVCTPYSATSVSAYAMIVQSGLHASGGSFSTCTVAQLPSVRTIHSALSAHSFRLMSQHVHLSYRSADLLSDKRCVADLLHTWPGRRLIFSH